MVSTESTVMANTDMGMDITKKMMSSKGRRFLAGLVLAATLAVELSGCSTNANDSVEEQTAAMTANSDTGTEQTTEESFCATVSYQGKTYKYNTHLINYIFMGVDTENIVETSDGSLDAGQTDALFMLSFDRKTGNVTMVSIPRDTIATYNMYGRDGTDLGPVEQQISLAYAYGDGKYSSCKMTRDAVSKLFYRIPVTKYLSAPLESLEKMSSVIGGVSVVVPNDSLVERDSSMAAGNTVEITEENVTFFLRTRDIKVTNSALDRLERQNAYLEAAFAEIMQQFSTDPGIVTKVFTAMEPYMVTNVGNDEFVKIMEGLAEGGTLTKWTIPGEGVAAELYDEFHVNEDMFYEKLIMSFFVEED